MAKIDKLPKQAIKPVDNYLKFVQQSFNTGGISFKEILKQLRAIGNIKTTAKNITNESKASGGTILSPIVVNEARQLANQLEDITLLTEFDKYKKFDKLGNFDLSDKGLRETYKVSEDIIKDINTARNWIKSYKKFMSLQASGQLVENTHTELIMLGQSILARAIELCPMDTGLLRSSGALFDMGDYIVIAFTAPYASYVHENLEIAHPHHGGRDCGGRAKFLEIALQEFFPDRTVWTEVLGYEGVMCKIGINPMWLEYNHYM